MYGKKRLLKSMSTKNIDSRHSNSIFSSSGTPRIKYAEIKLTPLSRNDFDMNYIYRYLDDIENQCSLVYDLISKYGFKLLY